MSWVEFSDSESRKAIEEIDNLSTAQRLEDLEQQVKRLTRDNAIMEQESFSLREPVLNSWCGIRPSSTFERRINLHLSRGNIRADIRAIMVKEALDPKVAKRWKAAFLDRYGVGWEYCTECDSLRDVSLEWIQLFNMRAHVSHRFQANRAAIIKFCDAWIVLWKNDHEKCVPSCVYRDLCRLYYES